MHRVNKLGGQLVGGSDAWRPPVCLVVGAGSGVGSAVAKRFARGGFSLCVVRRSDRNKLDALVNEIEGMGVKACGYLCDITEDNVLQKLVETIETNIGPIHIAVYNIGANVGDRSLEKTPSKVGEYIFWWWSFFSVFFALLLQPPSSLACDCTQVGFYPRVEIG